MNNARTFLNNILTTEQIEAAARATHDDGWYAAKQRDFNNPSNPFRGWGEKRLRVRDLTVEKRNSGSIQVDPERRNQGKEFPYKRFVPGDLERARKEAMAFLRR